METPKQVVERVRIVGLASSGNPFRGGEPSNHVFADCIACNMSIIAVFDSEEKANRFTDEQAEALFREHGWSIRPTLCPRCQATEEATCETCGGQGWYAEDDGRGEPQQVQCEACYGTGKKIAEEADDDDATE